MNILLSTVQILLGLHTLMGAVWKFSNTSQVTMPSLGVIPNSFWIAMAMIEILCAVGLILPVFKKRFANLVPIAAILIAVEMLVFCGLHLASGAPDKGPMIYWLVVAMICGFVASYRRFRKTVSIQ